VSFFVRQIPGECLTVQVSLTIRGCTSMLIRVWYWVFTIEWVVVYMRGVRHWDCWWWFIVVYYFTSTELLIGVEYIGLFDV